MDVEKTAPETLRAKNLLSRLPIEGRNEEDYLKYSNFKRNPYEHLAAFDENYIESQRGDSQ